VVRGGVEPPTFRFSGVLSYLSRILAELDASPAHSHKTWSSLLGPILAVVLDSAAMCRFVRGDLVVIFAGAGPAGFLWGRSNGSRRCSALGRTWSGTAWHLQRRLTAPGLLKGRRQALSARGCQLGDVS